MRISHANINALDEPVNFKSKTYVKDGPQNFVNWHKRYYNQPGLIKCSFIPI